MRDGGGRTADGDFLVGEDVVEGDGVVGESRRVEAGEGTV